MYLGNPNLGTFPRPEQLAGRPSGAVLLLHMRHTVGWSQETMAMALGLTVFSVHRWETGKTCPSPSHAVLLALAFSLPDLAVPGRWRGTEARLETPAAVRAQMAVDAPLVEQAIDRLREGRGFTGPSLLRWGMQYHAPETAAP